MDNPTIVQGRGKPKRGCLDSVRREKETREVPRIIK